MNISRREILKAATHLPLMLAPGFAAAAKVKPEVSPGYQSRRIAVEEAFATPELFKEWRKLLDMNLQDEPGFNSLYGFFLNNNATSDIRKKLLDIGNSRISEMDKWNIDMQILSITAPGTQLFNTSKANDFSRRINDQLSDVVEKYPNRFAGLAAISPLDVKQASIELERSINELGLKGVIINSHTKGEYLDDQKYWGLFETAQALDVPVYLHPRTPSQGMIDPYMKYGLLGAGWGFAAETSLHALRLILSGVFDEFPNLKIVLGHLGEGLPFWLPRIDSRFANKVWKNAGSQGKPRKRQKKPSDYFKDNFYIATSGMNWHPALKMVHTVLGADKMLFAVDYPYESSEVAVQQMDSFPISSLDKEKIYHSNAEKLFKIPNSFAS